ncbi:MAG: cytochrome c oxidase subunit II [Candidatus Riflebacteria bacterium]|nr:cytochrome c oxidase subunit II [Candidatus Riflebacteria bacterium]
MYPIFLSPGDQIDQTFLFIIGVSLVILLGLVLFTLFCLYKYHHSRNSQAEYIQGNLILEITWTVIPVLLVIPMFYFGWSGFKASRTVPKDAFPVTAIAKQWAWRFEYPNGKVYNELWVPQGKPIKVSIVSEDVLHSFYVPAFRIKRDAVPGMENFTWFRQDKIGTYTLYCAEYCGLQHSEMITQIAVLSPGEFENWYSKADTSLSIPERGLKALRMQGCLSCHSLDGTQLSAPTFKGLFGKETIVIKDGMEITVHEDITHLKSSILDPQMDIVKGFPPIMPTPKGLSNDDLDAMIEFIKTLR